MAEKPRVKLPKDAKKGEVVQIKTLISHVMETGLRKDQAGNTIPRKIINKFTWVDDDGIVTTAEEKITVT